MWNETGAAEADHELSALDQQMERIVAEAEAAAATVRSNLEDAQRTRESLLQHAHTECEELRMQAEAFAAETRDEAERGRIKTEALTQDLLERATREAAETRAAAIADAADTRDRADAIRALLTERLPALNDFAADLQSLFDEPASPDPTPAWELPAEPAPMPEPAPESERFFHPSNGEFEPIEPVATTPILHVVDPITEPATATLADTGTDMTYGAEL